MEKRIIHLESVNSTNSYLKDLARDGAKEGTVVIADRQTAGKGRLGRSFLSPDGGLYMSLLLRPEKNTADALIITAAAAVAVVRAIYSLCGKKCLIKWVNDIYSNGKKLCGILAEGSVLSDGKLDFAVLGIGINLFEPVGGFPDEIKEIATSLFGSKNIDNTFKKRLCDAVYDEFFGIYKNLSDRSFMKFYREHSMLLNRDIFYFEKEQKISARIIDIDDFGCLVVKNENGIKKINSGEVTVRINEDE